MGLFDEYNEPTELEVAANARLLAAAPDLLALAMSLKNVCDDRLSILQDERNTLSSDFDDIDDQIGHWTALRNQCESVLIRALPDSPDDDL